MIWSPGRKIVILTQNGALYQSKNLGYFDNSNLDNLLVPVEGYKENVASIKSIDPNNLAVYKNDGSISIIELNDFPSIVNYSTVRDKLRNGVDEICSPSPGGGALAALMKNGSVLTWGYIFGGGNSSIFAHIPGDALPSGHYINVADRLSSNVTSIYSNTQAFAAIKKDGSVVTWGNYASGGNSSITRSIVDSNTGYFVTREEQSVSDKLKSGVKKIYTHWSLKRGGGMNSSFVALKQDGSVVTWGNAEDGGDSSRVADHLSGNVTKIYSNGKAFAARKADGMVVTWGSVIAGGNSTVTKQEGNSTVELVNVSGNLASGVLEVYSGYESFAALKTDGSVVTWGNSEKGGDSSTVADKLKSGVKEILENSCAFGALKHDGSFVTWGDPYCRGDLSQNLPELATGVVDVSGDFLYALKDNGEVIALDYPEADIPESLKSGVTAIGYNQDGYSALKADGSVVMWDLYAPQLDWPEGAGGYEPMVLFARVAKDASVGSLSGNILIADEGGKTKSLKLSADVDPILPTPNLAPPTQQVGGASNTESSAEVKPRKKGGSKNKSGSASQSSGTKKKSAAKKSGNLKNKDSLGKPGSKKKKSGGRKK